MPLKQAIGIDVDTFSQFTHNLAVLCRLLTLEEPGWDREEVRRRADVSDILDRLCGKLSQIPSALGMVDADGPRSGLFFKSAQLFKAMKALFLREVDPGAVPGGARATESGSNLDDGPGAGELSYMDESVFELSNEPWLTDFLGVGSTWDFGTDVTFDTTFDS